MNRFFVIYRMADGEEQRRYFRFQWQARADAVTWSAETGNEADVCKGGDVLEEYRAGKALVNA